LARSCGPKSDTFARTGTPGPIPPSERNSTGNAAGANGRPRSVIRFLGRPARLGRCGEAGHVALHVGDEHRHAGGVELLDHDLQGLRLPGAGRARDQPVPIERRERHAHRGVAVHRAFVHGAAEVERGALGGVGVRDGAGEVGAHGGRQAR